jgi:hypothetical protein
VSDVPTILQQFAEKVGTTVERAWPLYVEYTWACALTGLLVGSFLFLALSIAAALTVRHFYSDRFDDSDRMFLWAMFTSIGLPVLAGVLCATCCCITPLISPEGAALHEILKQAAR